MTRNIAVALAAATLATACATTARPAATHHQAAQKHTATPAAAATQAGDAAANIRAFITGLASSAIPRDTVTGPVMNAYAEQDNMRTAADAAAGSPDIDTMNKIPGGYQVCATDTSGNGSQTCDTFTAFTTSPAGQITGVTIDGQPVAGRIATGTPDTNGGLQISNVVAYRLSSVRAVVITFTLRDTTSHALVNSGALGVFDTTAGQLNEDDTQGPTVPTLRPGEHAPAYLMFDTRDVTGTFTLRSNDGYDTQLATSTLTKAR